MTPDQNSLPDFDSLWDYEKPVETEARFRALLAKPETAAHPAYRLELLTQIARTLGLQRKFAEAHATLDEVERDLTPEMARARVRYLLERGRVFNTSGHPVKARPLFLKAWDEARAVGQTCYAIDAAHMMGIIEPLDEQEAWDRKALDLAEKSDEPCARRWRGSLYNNLGWTLHSRKEYAQALAMFQKGVAVRDPKQDPVGSAIARYCVARALRSLSRIDEALDILRPLHAANAAAGRPDPYVQEELGECLLLKHRPQEAAAHFAAAYRELSKDADFAKSEPARLARMKERGGG